MAERKECESRRKVDHSVEHDHNNAQTKKKLIRCEQQRRRAWQSKGHLKRANAVDQSGRSKMKFDDWFNTESWNREANKRGGRLEQVAVQSRTRVLAMFKRSVTNPSDRDALQSRIYTSPSTLTNLDQCSTRKNRIWIWSTKPSRSAW
jgi:hypothetical protein